MLFRCPCNEAPPVDAPDPRWTVCPACGLRGYQGMIIRAFYARIAQGYFRLLIALYTNGGKTRLIKQVIRHAVARQVRQANGKLRAKQPRRVAFFVHREELVLQVAATLSGLDQKLAYKRLKLGTLHLEGEPSVSIGVVKADYPERLSATIQIVSPKSIPGRSWFIAWLEARPALMVLDEGHTTGFYRETYPLLQSLLPDTPAVLLTATPQPAEDHVMSEVADIVIPGPLPAEAQDAGMLPRYTYRSVTLRQQVDARADTEDMIAAYREQALDRQGLVFCSDVPHAQSTAEAFAAAGVPAACIDGTLPREQRQAIYDRFHAGELRILTSRYILTTGIDWPQVCFLGLLSCVDKWSTLIQVLGRGRALGRDCLVLDAAHNIETHGGIEDIRPQDYGLDDKVGKHEGRVRRTCRACRLIIPADRPSCPCGYVFPQLDNPYLDLSIPATPPVCPDDEDPELWRAARAAYASSLRKCMNDGHSPSAAKGRAIYGLAQRFGKHRAEKVKIATQHALYPRPRQSDLESFYLYLQRVAAKPNRKSKERRDIHWLKRQLEAEFGPLLVFTVESALPE